MAPLLFSICNESEIHGVFLCTFLERGRSPKGGTLHFKRWLEYSVLGTSSSFLFSYCLTFLSDLDCELSNIPPVVELGERVSTSSNSSSHKSLTHYPCVPNPNFHLKRHPIGSVPGAYTKQIKRNTGRSDIQTTKRRRRRNLV